MVTDHNKRFYFLLPALWAITILLLSIWPQQDLPEFSQRISDKISHAAAYALLSFLVIRSANISGRISNHSARWYIFTFICVALYGTLLEVMQKIMSLGRSFEYMDIAANSIGAGFGLFAGALYMFLLTKNE